MNIKININLKKFANKLDLQSKLDTLLKKPLQALGKQVGASLPFCYEAEYFEDGSGFISIGVAKPLLAHFKKQRVKGQGKDEQGKMIKIDKKKVAYGQITLNEEGIYEFLVEGGIMRKPQLKAAIRSIGLLKKIIGDKFVILDKAVVEEATVEEKTGAETTNNTATTEDAPVEETSGETSTEEATQQDTAAPTTKAMHLKKLQKMADNLPKLERAVGVADANKVNTNIEKYQSTIADIKKEALANDGAIDAEEQALIDELETTLQAMKERLERLGGRKAVLVGKAKEKVEQGIQTAGDYVKNLLDKLKQLELEHTNPSTEPVNEPIQEPVTETVDEPTAN